VYSRVFREFPVPQSVLSPGTSSTCVRTLHISAQPAGRCPLLGVLLDRPRVSSSPHITRDPHDVDHHYPELRTGSFSGSFVYQGDRCLDGDVSGVCVWCVHRVFSRQRSVQEDKVNAGKSRSKCSGAHNLNIKIN